MDAKKWVHTDILYGPQKGQKRTYVKVGADPPKSFGALLYTFFFMRLRISGSHPPFSKIHLHAPYFPGDLVQTMSKLPWKRHAQPLASNGKLTG